MKNELLKLKKNLLILGIATTGLNLVGCNQTQEELSNDIEIQMEEAREQANEKKEKSYDDLIIIKIIISASITNQEYCNQSNNSNTYNNRHA